MKAGTHRGEWATVQERTLPDSATAHGLPRQIIGCQRPGCADDGHGDDYGASAEQMVLFVQICLWRNKASRLPSLPQEICLWAHGDEPPNFPTLRTLNI